VPVQGGGNGDEWTTGKHRHSATPMLYAKQQTGRSKLFIVLPQRLEEVEAEVPSLEVCMFDRGG
jgi:hypothetical protein